MTLKIDDKTGNVYFENPKYSEISFMQTTVLKATELAISKLSDLETQKKELEERKLELGDVKDDESSNLLINRVKINSQLASIEKDIAFFENQKDQLDSMMDRLSSVAFGMRRIENL